MYIIVYNHMYIYMCVCVKYAKIYIWKKIESIFSLKRPFRHQRYFKH